MHPGSKPPSRTCTIPPICVLDRTDDRMSRCHEGCFCRGRQMTLNCSGWTAQITDDDVAQRRGRKLADFLREKGFRLRTWFGALSECQASRFPMLRRRHVRHPCAAALPFPVQSQPLVQFRLSSSGLVQRRHPRRLHLANKGPTQQVQATGKQFAEARRSRKVPVRRTRGTRRNNKPRSNP